MVVAVQQAHTLWGFLRFNTRSCKGPELREDRPDALSNFRRKIVLPSSPYQDSGGAPGFS